MEFGILLTHLCQIFFLTKGVLSDWFLCQMSIPSGDYDIRLVIFYFEYKMFASLFRDSGIKWVRVLSYRDMMKTATSFFAFLHLMLCNKVEIQYFF